MDTLGDHGSAPTVLLLEDEFLIATDIEDELEGAGLQVVRFRSCRSAENWLLTHRPDAAVLDISLPDGPCVRVCGTLVDRGVPFLIHSACNRLNDPIDEVFNRGRWLPKPHESGEIAREVVGIIKSSEDGRAGHFSALLPQR